MNWTPVESTNVKAIMHDGEDLLLQFHSNVKYRYRGVPAHVAEEMIAAPSVGKFFHARIKNVYPYEIEESQ